MGVLFRARREGWDDLLALKVLEPAWSDDPALRGRFGEHVASVAAVRHPNLVPLVDSGEMPDGRLYVATRFVEGKDLGQLIESGLARNPARAVAIVGDVARALDAAHAGGLVHRNVKPSNILVKTSGDRPVAYLPDFALPRATAGRMGPRDVAGSPHHLAPEQIDGARADARTDVYALGC